MIWRWNRRFGRHRWLSRQYRTPWGDVPCECSTAARDAAIIREMFPCWLLRFFRCFLHDTDRVIPATWYRLPP